MYEGFSLVGKNAVVTGGTRGIGLAIAKAFLAAGASVTIASRRQDHVAQAMADLSNPEHSQGVAAHVAREDDRAKLIAAAEDRFGGVNVLVNNAGTNPFGGNIADSEERAWDKTMDVNLKAPYMLSVAIGKKMMESGGGSIINISSISGLQTGAMQGIYSVSKAALIMLTKVVARDMGPRGVRANAILPGLVKTQLSRALWEDEQNLAATIRATSLGRIGQADELAGAAIYLASDAGSYTSGAVIQVDGGMVI